ncbi:MAG: NACHT domain-containing protein [Candidatus Pacebacteria bacterium]|nr:NACHT domain-containing protein [Candidatus Paceibacterota bacterium]
MESQENETIQDIKDLIKRPVASIISPPVTPNAQSLPFNNLSWEDFEVLCLKLVSNEANVEEARPYGTKGQKQDGIDVYAKMKNNSDYSVYQCKNEKDFSPSKIEKAVTKFIDGKWLKSTKTFVLCSQESLASTIRSDEIEKQRNRLGKEKVKFEIWDTVKLNQKLKSNPQLVFDTFGPEWLKNFCGESVATSIITTSPKIDTLKLKKDLLNFYQYTFAFHDPGIPSSAIGKQNIPLQDRFVVPFINEKTSYSETLEKASESDEDIDTSLVGADVEEDRVKIIKARASILNDFNDQRKNIDNWLALSNKNIILGEPGSGKTMLLRFIALDLLKNTNQLENLSNEYRDHIPLWISFAFWTKMISQKQDLSMNEIIEKWLNSWSKSELVPLINQALSTKKILLLVDGLDEWSDELSAKIAIDRLSIFVGENNLPTFITSRINGFKKLGISTIDWKVGYIEGFDANQQKELSNIWFKARVKEIHSGEKQVSAEVISKESALETQNFLEELQNSPALKELGRIPLLLSLLILLKLQKIKLPQNRFKAYDELINHLIGVHPEKRKVTSGANVKELTFSNDELKKIFSHLAFTIQSVNGSGTIDQEEAKKNIIRFLIDDSYGLSSSEVDAKKIASVIVEVGEDNLGLLVKKSPQEIGFFHRAFQEYLSAFHISRLPLKEQKKIILENSTNPQWKEVILSMFNLSMRNEDTDNFIDLLLPLRKDLSNKPAIDSILYEVAFGDFNCSPKKARDLINEAFNDVESPLPISYREKVLGQILGGLRSAQARKIVEEKLHYWFPNQLGGYWNKDSVYKEMSSWPKETVTLDTLWLGVVDGSRNAGKSLAAIYKNDKALERKLEELIHSTTNPTVQAVALEALLIGWKNGSVTKKLFGMIKDSTNSALKTLSIIYKIANKQQTEKDRKDLIWLSNWESGLSNQWQADIADLLMKGWPHSQLTKKVALSSYASYGREFDRTPALTVLLKDYPYDKDVRGFALNQIKYDQHPFSSIHLDSWKMLSTSFKDDPELILAIDEWITSKNPMDTDASLASLLGRTEVCKKYLIKKVQERGFIHWPASALLDGWGIKDPDVKSVLVKIARGPVTKASSVAHLIPRIIIDPKEAKNLLMKMMRDKKCERIDFAVEGLSQLNKSKKMEGEIVTFIIDEVLPRKKARMYDGFLHRFIREFSKDSRVKEIAKTVLIDKDFDASIAAGVYFKDGEIRQRINTLMRSLPTSLKMVIAKYLAENTIDIEFESTILSSYDMDHDEDVKVQASIGFYNKLKSKGQDNSTVLAKLIEDIGCYGPDYTERRLAAFCGLFILGHLPKVLTLNEKMRSADKTERFVNISVIEGMRINLPMIKFVLENWDEIKLILKTEFWQRLFAHHSSSEYVWDKLCILADKYNTPKKEALGYFTNLHTKVARSNSLYFLERTVPKSLLLLEYCLNVIAVTNRNDPQYLRHNEITHSDSLVAVEILGRNFKGDEKVQEMIEARINTKMPVDENAIKLLSEGWPNSTYLQTSFDYLAKNSPQISWGTYFRMVSLKGSNKAIIKGVSDLLMTYEKTPQNARFFSSIIKPVLKRLQKDDELYQLMLKKIKSDCTFSERISFLQLILKARGLNSETKFILATISKKITKENVFDYGFDITDGEIKTLKRVLANFYFQEKSYS